MKVLVTGATGAFGAPVCAQLAARGIDVRAMARNRPGRLAPGVEFVAGDIRDAAAVEAAVAGCDRIVHLAWVVGVAKDPAEGEAINLTGTRNVIAAAQRHAIGKIVFASSVVAYGADPEHGPFREEDERRPEPALQYGYHKMIIEDELAASGVPAVMVRPNIVVGRSVGSMSVGILATPRLIGVRGEDRPFQFVHQDDVMRFVTAVTVGERTGLVNLASDGTASLERAGQLVGRGVARVPLSVLGPAIDLAFKVGLSEVDRIALGTLRAFPIADTTRLRTEWGFTPLWDLQAALTDTRRAVGATNVLGTKLVRRRGYPQLAPVGSAEADPGRVDPAVRRAVADLLPADAAFTRDLLGRAGAAPVSPGRHAGRVARDFVRTEVPLVLAPSGGPSTASTEGLAARAHQLADLFVDLVSLAPVCPQAGDELRVVGEALRGCVDSVGAALPGSALPGGVWDRTAVELVHAASAAPGAWTCDAAPVAGDPAL